MDNKQTKTLDLDDDIFHLYCEDYEEDSVEEIFDMSCYDPNYFG